MSKENTWNTNEKVLNRYKELSLQYGYPFYMNNFEQLCYAGTTMENGLLSIPINNENKKLVLDYLKRKLEDISHDSKIISAGLTLSIAILLSSVLQGEATLQGLEEGQVFAENISERIPKFNYLTAKRDFITSIDSLENEGITTNSAVAITNTYNTYLRQFASYYHFDGDKVIHLAQQMTDKYSIPFKEILNVDFEVECNPELEAMLFVNQLNRDGLVTPLKDMELSKDDFVTNEDIVTLREDLVLSNGLSYSEYLGVVSDLIGLDKEYALAISLYESGRLTSRIATNINNFGGLSNGSNYLTYATPEAGIIAYCCNLMRYKSYNLTSLEQLSGLYTQGNRNLSSETWIYNVSSFRYTISSNYDEYFITEGQTPGIKCKRFKK